MKINSINFINNAISSKKVNNPVKQLYNINFGRKHTQTNPNIKTSVNLGLELFNNPENAEKIISKYGNDIEF